MEEEQLISDLINRKESSFKYLVDKYQQRLYGSCFALLLNEMDAEDLTQEVFIEVYESISSFKGNASLSTWMHRIAVNACLDFIRKKKRKKRFAFMTSLFNDDQSEKAEIIGLTNFISPAHQLEDKERAMVLAKAVNKLPESQRTAFNLNKIEDLSYAEIAVIMDLTESSVTSLLFRAKENLRKYLHDYYKNQN